MQAVARPSVTKPLLPVIKSLNKPADYLAITCPWRATRTETVNAIFQGINTLVRRSSSTSRSRPPRLLSYRLSPCARGRPPRGQFGGWGKLRLISAALRQVQPSRAAGRGPRSLATRTERRGAPAPMPIASANCMNRYRIWVDGEPLGLKFHDLYLSVVHKYARNYEQSLRCKRATLLLFCNVN